MNVMAKKQIAGFALALSLVFTLFSCADNINENESKSGSNTYLMIAPEGVSFDARSIEPTDEYAETNLKSISLYATKTADSDGNTVSGTKRTLLSSIASLSAVYNKMLLLDDGAGTYTFEMLASLDSVYFYQKKENVHIAESKTNSISFALSPVKSSSDYSDFEDCGGFSVTMKFSTTNVSSIYVTLLNLDTNEITEQKSITSLNYGSVTYKKWASYSATNSEGRIPAGTYRLTFDFYSKDSTANQNVLINSFPYIVHVVRGRNAVIEQTYDLNQIYTITYNDNSGTLADGEIKATKFSHNSEVVLPIMTRDAYSFMGWYRDSAFTDGPVSKIEKGTTENQKFWAKFESSKLYVNPSSGNDDKDGSSSTNALKTFDAVLNKIKEANRTDYDWTIYVIGTFSESILIEDDAETGDTFPAKSITIRGSSGTSYGIGVSSGSALKVMSKVPVVLKNLTITSSSSDSNGSGIYIDSGSSVTLSSGVSVNGTQSSISGETCGGVYVKGALVMETGSSISGFKMYEGGGIYVAGGTVTMNGTAKIEDCSAKLGGGIYVSSGEVTMNGTSSVSGCTGSKISGVNDTNSAGGVDVGTNGIFTMNDSATITGCTGEKNGAGGVYAKGTFNMNGGSITGNTSGSSSDGMSGGAGGVQVAGGVFTMKNGSISGNEAAGAGGVYVAGDVTDGMGTFDMQGGSISSNTTTSTSRINIGVYLAVSTGLAGQGTGCGIFKMSGSAVVSDDNVVNMPSPSVLTVAGKLDSENAATVTFYTYSSGSYSFVYTEGEQVLALADGVTETSLEDEWKKIAVKSSTDDATGETLYWNIDGEGKLQNVPATYFVSSSGEDTNDGTTESTAFATISGALEKMIANGNVSADYTIKLSGTFTGAQTIGSSLTTGMAKSLTIEGVNGKNGEVWLDVLDGGFTSSNKGTTLTISTKVPVTIKNFKITGGYQGGGNGGGVKIAGDASLTMESGEISGNIGSDSGQASAGGVYMSHGGTSNFGATQIAGAIFTMNGGTICNNTGNGVTMYDGSNPGIFTMTGGTISGNSGYGVDMVYSTGPFGKFIMKGEAVVTADNKVFFGFPGSTKIYVAGELTGEAPVATISLNGYTAGTQMIALADDIADTTLEEASEKFAVTSQSSGSETVNWTVDSEGKLAIVVSVEPAYVNLGLPSGTLWATFNVGAASETDPGEDFSWSVDSEKTSILANYSSSGDTLLATDDQATVAWGENWRTPTSEQLQELYDNCYFEPVTSYNGTTINGYVVYLAKDASHTKLVEQANAFSSIEEYIKDGYSDSDPHIFLPARDGGEEVWMWSNTYRGTAYTDNRPIADLFGLADQWYDIIETEIVSSDYDYTYPVRPVYATTASGGNSGSD